MKFLKLFPRVIKNVAIGAVKSLPIVNVVSEFRDLKLKKEIRGIKQLAQKSRNNPQELGYLRNKILTIADIIDDGKLNNSVNEIYAEKITQLIASLSTTIVIAIWLLREFGIL